MEPINQSRCPELSSIVISAFAFIHFFLPLALFFSLFYLFLFNSYIDHLERRHPLKNVQLIDKKKRTNSSLARCSSLEQSLFVTDCYGCSIPVQCLKIILLTL